VIVVAVKSGLQPSAACRSFIGLPRDALIMHFPRLRDGQALSPYRHAHQPGSRKIWRPAIRPRARRAAFRDLDATARWASLDAPVAPLWGLYTCSFAPMLSAPATYGSYVMKTSFSIISSPAVPCPKPHRTAMGFVPQIIAHGATRTHREPAIRTQEAADADHRQQGPRSNPARSRHATTASNIWSLSAHLLAGYGQGLQDDISFGHPRIDAFLAKITCGEMCNSSPRL